MKIKIQVRFGLVALCCAALAFSTEIKMQTASEIEESLAFTAVDGNGRAVSDLKKSEIIFLVNGINFRGFSLIAPGGASFSGKPPAYPEWVKAPPSAYYEIVFPYIWDAGQAIRIQLGTERSGVCLQAQQAITKRKPVYLIENLQAEILALGLLRENTWLNLDLESLNRYTAQARANGRKQGTKSFYRIHLPADYLKNHIDLFKITFHPEINDAKVEQQWIAPEAALLEMAKESETYLLLANRQKAAALVMKNAPASVPEQMETSIELTADEKVKITAAITSRRKALAALQSEVKLIPVEIFRGPVTNDSVAGMQPSRKISETAAPDSRTGKIMESSGPATALALPDSKATILGKLEGYRSERTPAGETHNWDAALEYLQLNQVAKSLPLLEKFLDSLAPTDDFVSALLARLRRLHRFQLETQTKSDSLAAVDLQEMTKKIRSRLDRGLEQSEAADWFAGLQKILEKNQKGIEFVRKTLAEFLQYLEIADSEHETGNEKPGRLSLDPTAVELQKHIDFWLSLSGELADRTFFQTAWTSKVMNNLKQILERYALLTDAIEQCVKLIPEPMAESAIDFVMANSHAFPRPFKRTFYEKKLRSLGIADAWLQDPAFFNVVIQARAIENNSQNSWEAAFADDIVMVYIPSGSFAMGVPWESGGAEDESPQHEVELDAYWIAKNETTFYQYDRFCGDTGRGMPSDFDKGRKKRPVIGISYQNATDYCHWLSFETGVQFRLPTEAEWEKAARGRDQRKYPWGNSVPNDRLANFADVNFLKYYQEANPQANETEKQQMRQWIAESFDDGYIFTAPVGSYSQGASPYGVLDMAGNVCEWVSDWYDGNYYQKSPRKNPPGSSSGIYRVVRGGGWDFNSWMLRSTTRSGAPPIPGKGSESIGFRIAASPVKTTQ